MRREYPSEFRFHFIRDGDRKRWKLIHCKLTFIVDKIIVKVPCTTHTRIKKPVAMVKGKGILKLERYKEGVHKKIKAIIN